MRIHRTVARLLLALSLPLGVAGVLAASSPVGATAAVHTATTPRILNCQHQAVTRPASFIISCADANSYLQQMTWKSWGAKSARASGKYTMNSCTPNCAAGKFVSYPATVTLSAPKTVAGKRWFTILHVSYVTGTTTKSFNFGLLT